MLCCVVLYSVTLEDCFEYVVSARKEGLTIPVVLMGYYNPFLGYGEEKLVQVCCVLFCCVVLCFVVLFCVVLCCVLLCCVVLCCVVI